MPAVLPRFCRPLARLCQLLLALLLISSLATAGEIYKWRDAQGKLHFTDSEAKIPAAYRDQAHKHRPDASFSTVHRPEATAPATSSTPSSSAASSATGQAPSFSIPYLDREGAASRIIINVTFNGRVTAPILVDTGSPGLVISAGLASQLGLFKHDGSRMMVAIAGVGGSTVALRTIVDKLQIGAATEEFVPAHIVERMAEAYAGLIGMDVLSGYNLNIDTVHRRLVATVNPAAQNLPGGHGQLWWQALFQEFNYYNDFWKRQEDLINDSDSGYHSLPTSDFNQVREFIEFQRNESRTLLQKLDRQARWNSVPRYWRR